MTILLDYQVTVLIIGLVAVLQLLQLIVLDVMAIRRKHAPGKPIEAEPSDPLFRASRTFYNTNETLGLFILIVLFAMLSGGSAWWVNACSIVYFISRVIYAVAYYAGISALRSTVFGISLVALLALLIVGFSTWL